MSDDIFDYFGGHAAKKVEPIEDDFIDGDEDEEISPSLSSQDSPAEEISFGQEENIEATTEDVESASAIKSAGVPSNELDSLEIVSEDDSVSKGKEETKSDETDKRLSHWDRLLGKLGIAPPPAPAPPPSSIELPQKRAKTKAKRNPAARAEARSNEPFGGELAPPSEQMAVTQPSKKDDDVRPAESPTVESPKTEPARAKHEKPTRPKSKPAAKPSPKSSFGFGLFEEPDESFEAVSEEEQTPLSELFVPSDDFQEPFDEKVQDEDIHAASGSRGSSSRDTEITQDESDEDFVEFEVKDLDFSEDDKRPARRPSRRNRARRDREAGEPQLRSRGAVDRGDRTQRSGRSEESETERPAQSARGRSRKRSGRDEANEAIESGREAQKRRSRPARGRRPEIDEIRDDDDIILESDLEQDEVVAREEKEEPRGRRSRGSRGRGRSSRESRPDQEADAWDDEKLEALERDDVDADEDDDDDRVGKSRRSRGSRTGRRDQRTRVSRDADENDEFEVSRPRHRTRRDSEEESFSKGGYTPSSDEEEDDDRSGKKRPPIPTWDEAIMGMIESNIKSRGKASSGGRRPKRPRRK